MSPSVEDELRILYGDEPLLVRGVVHVVHAARGPVGRLHALRVGHPGAPHSDTDFFVLNLCRARADAVLTSAQNLRSEPALSHALSGAWGPVLADYRARSLGKTSPLTCAVLTRTGDLPDQHPFWRDGTQKVLLTDPTRERELTTRFAGRARVVGIRELDAGRACAWLQTAGHSLVSVEAGPSSTRTLYDSPSKVDELLLTLSTSHVPSEALAGPLAHDADLFRDLALRGATTRTEAGHTFRFERWTR